MHLNFGCVPRNLAWVEEFFWGMGIKVVTGHIYLGGLIGDIEAEKLWLSRKVTAWVESVDTRNHPQSAYAGPNKSLQQECAFVQQVTTGIGEAFGPVEKALKETLVPEMFEGLGEGAPERGVTRLPVKQVGLALPYPTLIAPEKWTVFCVITGQLIAALRVQAEFRTADHSACLQKGQTALWRRSQQRAE